MSRGEKWNEDREIKALLKGPMNKERKAGPILFHKTGVSYIDDSEKHVLCIGGTGNGKTQCVILPMVRSCIEHGESFVVSDSKGEISDYTVNLARKAGYDVKIIDFRHVRNSPTRWNPLKMPMDLFRSGNSEDEDNAIELTDNMMSAIYPIVGKEDPFWPSSAKKYAMGVTDFLLENADEDEINMASVNAMMCKAEEKFGMGGLMKNLVEQLPGDSLAAGQLATYVSAPNETRGSIAAVALNGIAEFTRNKGMRYLLEDDNLRITEIDCENPVAIYIILPDENDVYDHVAAVLVGQIVGHIYRLAENRYGGKLSRRFNFILDELGNIGGALTALDKLVTAGRSRNIRMTLCVQNYSQLVSITDFSKAETIKSSVGITIAFANNNWDTLEELSKRCGIKNSETGGQEMLISPNQLAAMEPGQALILIGNRIKYIAWLPFYYQRYGSEKMTDRRERNYGENVRLGKTFDLADYIKEGRRKKLEEELGKSKSKPAAKPVSRMTPPPLMPEVERPMSNVDTDTLIARIDAKILALDSEEAIKTKKHGYIVTIAKVGNKLRSAKALSDSKELSLKAARIALDTLPLTLYFEKKADAESFVKKMTEAGTEAEMKPISAQS
ncbi:MAG: type IV secretory system conjugative DNA transfer family protein [Firmicutes bacterium]|nr:type IV secretory system conjugative DNA transfer family protein [Bacillota bacterium]